MNPAPITARLAAFVAFKSVRLAVTLSGWALAAALAFITYADLRLEGPFGIGIGYEGWKPFAERMEGERDDALATIAEVETAQEEAAELAATQREAAQEQYRQWAKEAQNEIEELQARADGAFRDYAIRNRLRPQGGRGSGGAAIASPEGGSPAVPAELPADSLLAVEYADLRICNKLATYALGAHFWALDIDAGNAAIDAAMLIPPVGGQ